MGLSLLAPNVWKNKFFKTANHHTFIMIEDVFRTLKEETQKNIT